MWCEGEREQEQTLREKEKGRRRRRRYALRDKRSGGGYWLDRREKKEQHNRLSRNNEIHLSNHCKTHQTREPNKREGGGKDAVTFLWSQKRHFLERFS